MTPVLKLTYLLALAVGLFFVPESWGVWPLAGLSLAHLGLWAASGVSFAFLASLLRRLGLFFAFVALIYSFSGGGGGAAGAEEEAAAAMEPAAPRSSSSSG